MKAILNVPYSLKDAAKKIAKDNQCVMYFNTAKQWEIIGKELPKELNQYLVRYVSEDVAKKVGVVKKNVIAPVVKKVVSKSPVKKPTVVKSSQKSIVVKKAVVKKPAPSSPKPLAVKGHELPSKYYKHVLDIPFSMRYEIGRYGVWYDSENKIYIAETNDLREEMLPFVVKPFSYEYYMQSELNEGKDFPIDFSQKSEITPRDYQESAYKIINQAVIDDVGGFLLADEVGLGKTITAGMIALNKDFEDILVVTTLSACAHWRKTFIKMGFGQFIKTKKIIIINYDRLQKLIAKNESGYKTKAKSKKAKNSRLANKGDAPSFDLVIWDESHKMKNNTAMRSKLGVKLAENAGFNLYMSATAGQNPLELSYLAPLFERLVGSGNGLKTDFEKWCISMNLGVSRGDYGKWQWDGSQQSIDKIHTLLFKSKPLVALRRTPQDIAGYPEIVRDLLPIEYSSEEIMQYGLAWNDFKNVVKNNKQAVGRQKNEKENNVLVAKLRLRQKSSLLKIPYTIEMVEDLLEKGHQVAISVNFKDTMFEIEKILAKSKIKCSKIYGDLNPTEKEDERLDFQNGRTKVVLFTVEEAISLHQGEYNNVQRSMIIHDIRWSAISMSQIEGRTHRDGKFSQIYWTYAVGTIEEDIAKIVLGRVISMKGMIGDDTMVLKEIEALLLSRI